MNKICLYCNQVIREEEFMVTRTKEGEKDQLFHDKCFPLWNLEN